MFYFLGLVLKNDIAKGNIVPSYTLHKRLHPREGGRSEYYVQSAKTVEKAQTPKPTQANCRFWGRPKVLVTTPYGHDHLVNIMSMFRDTTLGNSHSPKGSLFWFPCNEYGKIKGAAIWIKNVPDYSSGARSKKKERNKDWLEELIKVNKCMNMREAAPISLAKNSGDTMNKNNAKDKIHSSQPSCRKSRNKNGKVSVINTTTGDVYESIIEAEKQTGALSQNICRNCNNRIKTAGGYVWKYYDDYVKEIKNEELVKTDGK